MNRNVKRVGWIVGGGAGAAALWGLGQVVSTWYRYGHVAKGGLPRTLLDQFLPTPEVLERHQTRVAAPAGLTYRAARQMDLMRSWLVRSIFRGRELLMRAERAAEQPSQPLVDQVLALGWGVLAQDPGRELVFGAVTQPWEADVHFRALPPDEFAAFDAPGYVKIAWNIRVEPLGAERSRFSTETRVATTDAYARRRFRTYWTMVAPGVRLIRRASLRIVRSDAERRYHAQSRRERRPTLETW